MSANLIERYKAIQAIGTEIEIPYHIWSLFRADKASLRIVETDICLGEDFTTVEGARSALEWYVAQLGGTVKWSKI